MGFFDKLFKNSGVTFKERYSSQRASQYGSFVAHYEVYTGKSAQVARDFLNAKSVTKPFTYILVETPEGNWGLDNGGLYLENA